MYQIRGVAIRIMINKCLIITTHYIIRIIIIITFDVLIDLNNYFNMKNISYLL